MICFFAVAEDLEDLLISWMAQTLSDGDPEDPNSHRWRGAILRGVVHAHLLLDHQKRADDAIRSFLAARRRVLKARESHVDRKEPLARAALYPALSLLSKTFTRGWSYNTDPELFDEFVEVFCNHGKGTDDDRKNLMLYHPTRPDPEPYYAYIRDSLGKMSKTQYETFYPPRSSASKAAYSQLRTTEELLRAKGLEKDADYIKRLMESLLDEQEHNALRAGYNRKAPERRSVRFVLGAKGEVQHPHHRLVQSTE